MQMGKFIIRAHLHVLENQDKNILKDKISLFQMLLTLLSCKTQRTLYLEGYKTWVEFSKNSNVFLPLLSQKVKLRSRRKEGVNCQLHSPSQVFTQLSCLFKQY